MPLGARFLGPEHEFSISDPLCRPLSISDKVLRTLGRRVVNKVQMKGFILSKELQMHVLELKPNTPFEGPREFENTMQNAVIEVSEFLEDTFGANMLGLGMHPLLDLQDARVWSHRDKRIYDTLGKIFDLRQHGWVNIQSFQLNLSFAGEQDAVRLYNCIAQILPYLVALSAASPVYENRISDYEDSRLYFYKACQNRVPSIVGDVIPEPIKSFDHYREVTIDRYSADLARLDSSPLLCAEWINSRGAIIRFRRKAIEIRIMDEQECIRSDVALACFIRSMCRAWIDRPTALPHEVLVRDYESIVRNGLHAQVRHPFSSNSREVCERLLTIALEFSTREERPYLRTLHTRLHDGNLAECILKSLSGSSGSDICGKMLQICRKLARCLVKNETFLK
jgi:gamma-glutamyl:cysteine ligase YbdK (ATP-grasp superfamily)